jgi:hypothetical protein
MNEIPSHTRERIFFLTKDYTGIVIDRVSSISGRGRWARRGGGEGRRGKGGGGGRRGGGIALGVRGLRGVRGPGRQPQPLPDPPVSGALSLHFS